MVRSHTVRAVLAAVFFSIVFVSKVHTICNDSCLAVRICNDSALGTTNIDSMLFDTCYLSPTAGEMYARGGFLITFDDDVFHLPYAPADSIIEVTWQDMDTNYPDLRAAFDTIYQRYGAFVLRKMYPQDTI